MAKLSQLASPVLRRGARLHADEARQARRKLEHLAASKLFRYFLKNWLVESINAVHLENGLGEIGSDRANLNVDGSQRFSKMTITFAH